MTTLNLSDAAATAAKVDAVVIGVTSAPGSERTGRGAAAARVGIVSTPALRGLPVPTVAAALAALGATGSVGEVTRVAAAGLTAAPLVVAVGLGEATAGSEGGVPTFAAETLRRAAGSAVRALSGTARVALALPAERAVDVAAVAEGALFGAYAFTRYRTEPAPRDEPVAALTLLTGSSRDKAVKAAADRARAVAAAVHLCRDWVNTAPGDLPPAALADAASAAARGRDLTVAVLDDKALRKGGYGGIVGVGQGSSRPPRLVKITYRGPKAKRHLALVGKGITFDSGGLSLKPPQAMETMKCDMAGAAAVIAAITAIADLRLPIDVTAWGALAENMPGGAAQRPSDVLVTYGGRTVEVLNTDAEGRLVLADALVAAGEDHPDLIVDVATLTGAAVVALGTRTSGIMSNDDAVRTRLHEIATDAGEAMWPMPLPTHLRAAMDSKVADIANIGDRKGGGMLTAGLFLQEFIGEGQRWAHLDIAGPAFNEGDAFGYTPRGGTGTAVRTFVRLAEELAAGTV